MKGLYINFELKRRGKLSKVMDYFFAIALGILAFIILFYMPYVTRSNKYNKANQDKQALIARKTDLEEQILPYLPENASALQLSYNRAYNEIATNIINHSCYIEDLYDSAFEGVTINRIKIATNTSMIELSVTFSSNEDFYKYKSNLLDLPWVPNNGVIWDNIASYATWEVLIDEPTI